MKMVHEVQDTRDTADRSRKCLAADLQIAWVYCVAWPVSRGARRTIDIVLDRVLSFPLSRSSKASVSNGRVTRAATINAAFEVAARRVVPAPRDRYPWYRRDTRGTMDREQVTENLF